MSAVELAKAIVDLKQAINDRFDSEREDMLKEVYVALEEWDKRKSANATYEPSKLEKIERYLHVLYEAQKVGHNAHKEIAEALEQFKKEAGI